MKYLLIPLISAFLFIVGCQFTPTVPALDDQGNYVVDPATGEIVEERLWVTLGSNLNGFDPRDITLPQNKVPAELRGMLVPEGDTLVLTVESNVADTVTSPAVPVGPEFISDLMAEPALSQQIMQLVQEKAPGYAWLLPIVLAYLFPRFRTHVNNAVKDVVPGLKGSNGNGRGAVDVVSAGLNLARAVGLVHTSKDTEEVAKGTKAAVPLA